MHVSKDRNNRAGVAARRLCPPRFWIEMSEDELIHPFADGVALKQCLAKLRREKNGNVSHDISLRS
jgi:hypothetical protein